MPLHIIREDITRMEVDVIVAAGNASPGTPKPTGGVNGSIHKRAGERLLAALRRLGGVKTGGATITPGYDLPSKYVIHTAGPVWRGGSYGEEMLLRACYAEALRLAQSRGLTSIAFPLISAGTYGYPREQAMQVAMAAIREFLDSHEMTVYLVVYDRESFRLSSELCGDVQQFIDQHYVDEHPATRNAPREAWLRDEKRDEAITECIVPADDGDLLLDFDSMDSDAEPEGDPEELVLFGPESMPELSWLEEAIERRLHPEPPEESVPAMQQSTAADDDADWYPGVYEAASSGDDGFGYARPSAAPSASSGRAGKLFCEQEEIPDGLLERLRQLDEGFSGMLLRLIDERGMKDSACYRRANVDRKLFSKIRNTPGYTPKKSTVAAFCIALELDMDMSRELLSRAGYAFSHSSMFDVIVEYFIHKRQYDVDAINQVLFAYDQPLLGSNVG